MKNVTSRHETKENIEMTQNVSLKAGNVSVISNEPLASMQRWHARFTAISFKPLSDLN